jgi:hypothetical protein
MAHLLGDANPMLAQAVAEHWLAEGDQHQALLWHERALDLRETPEKRMLLRRAELLLGTNQPDRAEAVLRPLAGSENQEVAERAHLLLGHIARQREQPDASADHLEQAVRAGLDDPAILAFLGSHYFNRSR